MHAPWAYIMNFDFAGIFRLRFVNPKYWNGNVGTALEATYKIKRHLGFYRWI